ncbi:inorganic pyrophosphatase [Candidatus Gottesmanbacteria bacterium RIFCSPHIGHO2_01_FULL_46_14]|uniref:Inorganic pyrophosphatase n=3 Tax=Microgenomates group TaxID=1794810 RepID=A0A1F5ZRL3_9BACT|nr:MAG: Inorganic pyrophosphatase [Candidatus Curtissbacteria bacterium GW2011_GWA1_41_11]OGG14974.1 MAG: inorganic pyrophosphatase [Candidatus Gottesmanbacteria bacterium RIFCSPHIGHO2_01_FULL_46_14]OGG30055.1 MAG: inorganic pyrophosphatase [Candidatus Gottesmanbacteria bacterium RIFCSPLOWO2_01_FULL_46_21]
MNLSPGKNPPDQVNVFVEIPQGSAIKYELDKDSGVIFVDRFLYTAFSYPFNYGFVPGTKAEDGDPVDVLVICDRTVAPGTVIPAVPIGMLEMEDEEGIDTKIIAVPTVKVDPLYGVWKDISDVPQALKDKMKHFFEHYKELEPGKWVKIKDWKNKAAALEDIKKGLK